MNESGDTAIKRNFLNLWTARTIPLFGSTITTLALPLTAIRILHATPFQIGMLLALGQVPQILFGFVMGAWMQTRNINAQNILPLMCSIARRQHTFMDL